MKKAGGRKPHRIIVFIVVIVLVAACGLGFFRGWVNFAVPQGSFAVLRSKSHGVDSELVEPGRFMWRWYRLIPRDTDLVVFSPEQQKRTWSASGTLPQSETLAAFTGLEGNFSWQAGGTLAFNVKPEAVPALFSSNIIGKNGLDAWLSGRADEMAAKTESICTQIVSNFALNADETAALPASALKEQLAEGLKKAFPDMENVDLNASWTGTTASEPDFGLYALSRGVYTLYLEKQKDALAENTAALAARRQNEMAEIQRLERYGELLTRYPVLGTVFDKLKDLP
jgi:hypothetical protein